MIQFKCCSVCKCQNVSVSQCGVYIPHDIGCTELVQIGFGCVVGRNNVQSAGFVWKTVHSGQKCIIVVVGCVEEIL